MLQRSSFAQKRRLDWTSIRCRYSIHRSTFHLARCLSTPSIQTNSSSSSTHVPLRPGNIKALENVFQNLPEEILSVVEDLRTRKSRTRILQSIKRSPELSSFFSNPRQTRKLVNAFAKSSTPLQSLQVLKLAYRLGHTLHHQAYESACFHLGASRQWDVMLAVTLYGERHLGYTSIRLLNWRATALMETRQYALLEGILDEFKAANLSPNQRTYHLILIGCIRNHDLEGCKRCLRDMKEAGFSPNATTQVLISKSYWQFGADAEVRRNAIASLPELPLAERITVINNLLQFSLEQHELPTVVQLLSTFDDTSAQDFLSIISRELENGINSRNSIHPLTGIEKIKPNADTLSIFMNYQIKTSNPEAAIRLWKAAAMTGLSATSNVIAALIHAYFLQGRGNIAIRMVATISLQPEAKGFDSLMIDPTHDEEPPPLNLPCPSLTIRTCNVLLKSILQRQGLAPVPNLFAIMHANNLKPNDRTLELLLSHMSHRGEPRPRNLFQMARVLAFSNAPSSRHMHHILSCVLRDEKRLFIDSAWKKRLFKHRLVNERRCRVRLLNRSEYFDPMAGLYFSKHLSYDNMARPILRSLTARKVKSDPAMVFLRMRRDAALHLEIDSALGVFRTLRARGLRPTEYHYGALLEGYALSGNFASAETIMAAATEAGIKPNVVMYTILIAAYAKHRDSTSAMQVFKKMISAGIHPDVPSIDALVSAFQVVNDLQTARRLLIKLWPYIQPFPKELHNAEMGALISHFRNLHPYKSRGIRLPKPKRHAIRADIQHLLRAHKRYFIPRLLDLSKRDKNDSVLGK